MPASLPRLLATFVRATMLHATFLLVLGAAARPLAAQVRAGNDIVYEASITESPRTTSEGRRSIP